MTPQKLTLRTVDTSKPVPPVPASVEMQYRLGVLDGYAGKRIQKLAVHKKYAHGHRLGVCLRDEQIIANHRGTPTESNLKEQIAAWATQEALERDGITGAPGTFAANQRLWAVDLNA